MENKNQDLLHDRLEENYQNYVDEWLTLTPFKLIEKAEEICATQLVKEHLLYSVNEERAAWLLCFQNPLELMRDKWMEENGIGTVQDESISHALWSAMDYGNCESFYALMPDVEPNFGRDVPVTIRKFIEQHPNATLDLMTPGGYVYLTPERTQLLLCGQSLKAHPGSPEYSMDIPAEELLKQEICEATFSEGIWHILSDCIREPEQEQTSSDQGVTMC